MSFGPEKLFFLLLIVLVLFGAKRIPEVGGSIAKGIREFKRNLNDVQNHIAEHEPDVRPSDRLAAPDRTVAAAATREDARPEPKRLIGG